MDILKRFIQYVFDNKLVNVGGRVLLAVSGGKDSMLMLWLFHQAGFDFEIAHCNFNLRGVESDADEKLVLDWASKHGVVCHVKSFDTEMYAQLEKVSIQLAARELRYNWFEELRIERACTNIAIAQHVNDNIETLLFNLSRGTGLKGLTGIKPKRNNIIRPLLFLTANEIFEFVNKNCIPYRDDASNFSNKYARNKIRLDIIPQFEKLNKDFVKNVDESITRFQEAADVLSDLVAEQRSKIFIPIGDAIWKIAKASIYGKKMGLLYLLFEPYNFNKNVLEDLMNTLYKESGRFFESDDYVILNDRDYIILKKRQCILNKQVVNIESTDKFGWGNFNFYCQIVDDCTIERQSNIVKIDLDKVILPLYIRTWQIGDVFKPLGMKGNKKVSDLFIQRKINVLQKQEIPILCNGNDEIIWIAGIQMDDRYKITQKTKKVLKLVLLKN